MSQALRTIPGTIVHKTHHAPPKAILEARESFGLPTVTMVREPTRHMLSYYWPYTYNDPRRYTFAEYIITKQEFLAPMYHYDGLRLNIYEPFTDQFFLFEDSLEAFLEHWGLSDITLPTIGKEKRRGRSPDPAMITDEHRDLMRRYYLKDVILYNRIAGLPEPKQPHEPKVRNEPIKSPAMR
jgi:hypothetical protein